MYDNITGIILSGGKSTRMGENKSLMIIKDRTVIEHVSDLMESIFSKVILISNNPDEYKFLDLDIYQDIFFRKGPLAGIHSGLSYSSTEQNFIISCDIPFMTSEMITYLTDYKTEKPVTVAKADGFIQQLCGRYDKRCLHLAENILKGNENDEKRSSLQNKRRCNVLSLLDTAGAEIIDAESLPFYKKQLYFNMNRRKDYDTVLKLLSNSD